MSLALAAKHLAAQGRNGDSLLVHMAPEELQGLNALAMAHGGGLTVNPHTGLVEAFKLRRALKRAVLPIRKRELQSAWKTTRNIAEKGAPVFIGAGLTALSGGTLSPLTAGMIVGGGQYARTGDINKGLMAGLSAYGGAGIAEGLAGAGAAGTSTTTPTATEAAAGWKGVPYSPPSPLAATPPPVVPTPAQFSQSVVPNLATAPASSITTGATPPPSMWDKIVSTGKDVGKFASENKMALGAAGLGLLGSRALGQQPQIDAPPPNQAYLRPYEYSPGYMGGVAPAGAGSDYAGERMWFQPTFNALPVQELAEGGAVELEKGGFVVPADVVSALGNGSSSAGLELLAKHIGARPIKGPGDGMSDSIPTSIEGSQKAAIARDEAYVPREKVQAVGGSKRLYEMMDRVRHQAHGKPSQQRKLSNPAKLVP